MNAQEAAAVADDAARALSAAGTPAYAVIEDFGEGEYEPRVAISADAAYELAHQAEVEGA